MFPNTNKRWTLTPALYINAFVCFRWRCLRTWAPSPWSTGAGPGPTSVTRGDPWRWPRGADPSEARDRQTQWVNTHLIKIIPLPWFCFNWRCAAIVHALDAASIYIWFTFTGSRQITSHRAFHIFFSSNTNMPSSNQSYHCFKTPLRQ